MIKFFARNSIKYYICLMISLIIYIILLNEIRVTEIEIYSSINSEEKQDFGEITSNNTLIQKIELDKNQQINYIKVLFATYARINSNTNKIKIYYNGKVVYDKKISSANIKDYSTLVLNGFNIDYKTSDDLYVEITSHNASLGNAITTYITTDEKTGNLYSYDILNNKYTVINGELCLSIGSNENTLLYISKHFLNIPLYLTIFLFLILSAGIILILINLLTWKNE